MVKILAISIQLARVIPFYYRKLGCCPSCDQPRHGRNRSRKEDTVPADLLCRETSTRERKKENEERDTCCTHTPTHTHTRIHGDGERRDGQSEEPRREAIIDPACAKRKEARAISRSREPKANKEDVQGFRDGVAASLAAGSPNLVQRGLRRRRSRLTRCQPRFHGEGLDGRRPGGGNHKATIRRVDARRRSENEDEEEEEEEEEDETEKDKKRTGTKEAEKEKEDEKMAAGLPMRPGSVSVNLT
ncbi:hypothetical protein K0M31_004445 [Melipona bicolor]|uniref:Uncharacterized protein n=1 Tax=Melipona bicolor TaxID=60889 RepID=A0AA40FWT4_9HYME|nr:hypothetical protein K0M31_004445 [Melipona bicolor]